MLKIKNMGQKSITMRLLCTLVAGIG
ncbi:MAG: hypothetical protein RL748_1696, partial [Pseudomonadota bacterium]